MTASVDVPGLDRVFEVPSARFHDALRFRIERLSCPTWVVNVPQRSVATPSRTNGTQESPSVGEG